MTGPTTQREIDDAADALHAPQHVTNGRGLIILGIVYAVVWSCCVIAIALIAHTVMGTK